MGPATTVSSTDSGGTGPLTASDYTDNHTRSLTLDSRTHTFTRDPLDRTSTTDSSGASKPTLTTTDHYSDDDDTPVSIGRSDATTERDITGPSGMLVATKDGTTLVYLLRDVQGSIVSVVQAGGSVSNNTNMTPSASSQPPHRTSSAGPRVCPAGAGSAPTNAPPTSAKPPQASQARSRWVPAPIPQGGRLQRPDPIPGGSINAYAYVFQDPTNAQDLSGEIGGLGAIAQGIENVLLPKPRKQAIKDVKNAITKVRTVTKPEVRVGMVVFHA